MLQYYYYSVVEVTRCGDSRVSDCKAACNAAAWLRSESISSQPSASHDVSICGRPIVVVEHAESEGGPPDACRGSVELAHLEQLPLDRLVHVRLEIVAVAP